MSIFTPEKIVIPTDGVTFGARPPMTHSVELQMFQDQVGSNPIYTIEGDVPFSYSIESGTAKPKVILTFDKTIDNIELGKEYQLKINGAQNVLAITFAYGDSYRRSDWRMSDSEDRAGASFVFKEVQHGTQIVSQILNTKLRMLFGFIAAVNFQLTDFTKRRETKKRLRDIIDCAVAGTGFPKNCHATISRETDGRVSMVDLTYSEGEEPYTRITYTYIDGQITYVFDDPSVAEVAPVTKPFLHRITIDRMIKAVDSDARSLRYNICSVQFVRSPISYPTLFGCTVTMPAITSWDVIE